MCKILIHGCHSVESYSIKDGTTIVLCRKEGDRDLGDFQTEIFVTHDVLPETKEIVFLPYFKEEVEDVPEAHSEMVEIIPDITDDAEEDYVQDEYDEPEEVEKPLLKHSAPRAAKKRRRTRSGRMNKIDVGDFIAENTRLKCKHCGKSLKTIRSFRNHMKLHGKRKYECERCDKSLSSLDKLERHMRIHTGKKPFQCQMCSRTFDYRHSLDIHMRSHTKERPYACHICTKTYTTKGNLNLHLRAHAGVKMFVCDICGKACDTKGNLRKHMEIHNEERMFECPICPKTFLHPASRERHIKSHSGEKKHKCDICEKAFMRRDHLNNHLAVHRGKDP